jgi:hypothetical protein
MVNMIKTGLVCCILLASSAGASTKPTTKEALELLPAACQGKFGPMDGGYGCNPCPKYIDANGLEGDFGLSNVMYGKFTDAKKTDALLDMYGCEAHVNNFGGSVLLRWQGLTIWKFTRYAAGFRSSDCLKYPARDGRDLLLCRSAWMGQGYVIEGFGLTDLLQKTDQSLFQVTDNTASCMGDRYYSQRITTVQQIKLNSDRYPDLRVGVEVASATPPKNWECGKDLTTGKKRTYSLEFIFDGAKFTPTRATQKIVQALEEQAK